MLSALLLLAAFPLANASSGVTVHLSVTTVAGEPTIADCDVTVPSGSTVESVLNAALAAGCVVEWHCTDFGFDCFVDSIDFVPGAGVLYWAFYVDGVAATNGIRGTTVHAGAEYAFELDQWAVFPSPI